MSRHTVTDVYEAVLYMLEHWYNIHYVIGGRHNNLLHILLNSYEIYDNTDRRDLLLQCLVKVIDADLDINMEKEHINLAARRGWYEEVLYMLEHGFNKHYVDEHHDSLLRILLDNYERQDNTGRRDVLLECLVDVVDNGADVNKLALVKETPIRRDTRKGLYEAVLYMLEYGFNKRYVDERHNNLLHILLDSYESHDGTGKRDMLLQCLVKVVDTGVDVNQLNAVKETPICRAAIKGLYEVVLYMLEHGFNKHYVDERHKNVLHIVLDSYNRHGNTGRHDLLLKCVVKIVDAGVDVNKLDAHKYTPILIAVGGGLYEAGIYLLEHGVDVHYVDIYKCNILHYVLCFMYPCLKYEEKYIQLVNTLINLGINVNQPNYEGNTPLFYFHVNGPPLDDKPPFHMSKLYGIKFKLQRGKDTHVQLKCKLINSLLGADCNVNHRNKKGRTALMHHLEQQADASILKLLIQHSDLSLADIYGYTALCYCVQYHMINSTNIFKLFVDSGSDLISPNNGVKLYHKILNCKRLELFNYYIGRRLIVKGLTAEGENMLHLLAGVNYDYSLNKFKWLLNNELDINHQCSKTNTPTMIAAFLLNSKYLELLTLHPRLEINAQNNQGHTALHLCILGFTMFKDGLNKRQVNDVVKNYCRQIYPIYMACIDILLGVDGIDVNIPDNVGRTSLMMAAMKNDRVLIRKLLQAGAIVTMLDYSGRSALQYLNIYHSVFDLTCFKLLLSNGNTGLLNLPCLGGNTIIQTVLCFPFFWEPRHVICFIRYLIAENCCIKNLVTSSAKSNYNQFDLIELSLPERDKLRKLLYLSGAEGHEIMTTLNLDEENKPYEEDKGTFHSRGTEKFIRFCSNISLMSMCRRIIRQKLGLGIKEQVNDLELPYGLNDFLLLKDVLHPQDYYIDNIDDGCNDFDDDDDYDGYDIDRDRDFGYRQYNYQYFTLNTDYELRQDFLKTQKFPNGEQVVIS
ncbi:putative ankyrin repeat protein RF_0381 isoform X2 [Patella vulgata]|uniref:putative ankyrin repeat protein RF_0381 isoform X2 n=1 Tax=Patella vulgata TaxID=6465 RepID=UPI00217F8923|nr:putative ankyrin repeat protein RF_0381 isoform X2 [Patella vulgata]